MMARKSLLSMFGRASFPQSLPRAAPNKPFRHRSTMAGRLLRSNGRFASIAALTPSSSPLHHNAASPITIVATPLFFNSGGTVPPPSPSSSSTRSTTTAGVVRYNFIAAAAAASANVSGAGARRPNVVIAPSACSNRRGFASSSASSATIDDDSTASSSSGSSKTEKTNDVVEKHVLYRGPWLLTFRLLVRFKAWIRLSYEKMGDGTGRGDAAHGVRGVFGLARDKRTPPPPLLCLFFGITELPCVPSTFVEKLSRLASKGADFTQPSDGLCRRFRFVP